MGGLTCFPCTSCAAFKCGLACDSQHILKITVWWCRSRDQGRVLFDTQTNSSNNHHAHWNVTGWCHDFRHFDKVGSNLGAMTYVGQSYLHQAYLDQAYSGQTYLGQSCFAEQMVFALFLLFSASSHFLLFLFLLLLHYLLFRLALHLLFVLLLFLLFSFLSPTPLSWTLNPLNPKHLNSHLSTINRPSCGTSPAFGRRSSTWRPAGISRVSVKASPAFGRRRLHTNTDYIDCPTPTVFFFCLLRPGLSRTGPSRKRDWPNLDWPK